MPRGREGSSAPHLSQPDTHQVPALPARVLRKLTVHPLLSNSALRSSRRLQPRSPASLLWHRPRALRQALNRAIIHAIIMPGRELRFSWGRASQSTTTPSDSPGSIRLHGGHSSRSPSEPRPRSERSPQPEGARTPTAAAGGHPRAVCPGTPVCAVVAGLLDVHSPISDGPHPGSVCHLPQPYL